MAREVTDQTSVTFRLGRLIAGAVEGTSYRKLFAYMFPYKRGVYVGNIVNKPDGSFRWIAEVQWTHTLLKMEGEYFDSTDSIKEAAKIPLEARQEFFLAFAAKAKEIRVKG